MFLQAGTHYVCVRGLEATDSDDSLHVGLGGVAQASSDRMTLSTTGAWE
jgi:hypothetical protein